MPNEGDLVTYVNASKLLNSMNQYVGKHGIVIKKMDPDTDELFYMVLWGDTIRCVMKSNLKIIQHTQKIHTEVKNEFRE